jgi:ERF superfamily
MKLITAALIAAKAKFTPIHKNKVNPHFKFKYATLDEILEANDCRRACASLPHC